MSIGILSLLISAALTLCGLLINLFVYRSGGVMPLSFTSYGGEIIIDIGFGLRATHIYSMLPGGGDSKTLHFDILSFLFTMLVIFLIVYLVLSYFSRKKTG